MNRFVFVLVVMLSAGSAAAQSHAAADPLQARVTIDYRDTAAAVVIAAVAAAAGLKVDVGAGNLRPVTITLTNVTLGTALNALCENASCVWRLQGALIVTPVPDDRTGSLPPRVSFVVRDTPASDAFRALAAAIGVDVTVDPAVERDPVSFSFTNAATAEVLDVLCHVERCEWEFDATRGLRVTRKP